MYLGGRHVLAFQTLKSDRFSIFSEFLSEKPLIARNFLTVIARELIY
jgi:hypothetical protein